METGYEDIDRLTTSQNQMLDNALKQQQEITNKQTEMNVAELEKNKLEVDKDADKTNKALYAEYRKASNPYGVNAENLASQGLGNSGYAETTQTNLYNTYQKNITDTLNNARDLKADVDLQISKARQTGDITLAQNALEIYNQKMQLLTQEYELRNNREQYLYQKEQDALAQSNWEKQYAYQQQRDQVADNQYSEQFAYQKEQDMLSQSNWEKEFLRQQQRDQVADSQYAEQMAYQKDRDAVSDRQYAEQFDYQKNRDSVSDSQWQQSFDYQKQRDAVSDSQWLQQYNLSKKKSSSGSSSGSSKSGSSDLKVNLSDESSNAKISKLNDNTLLVEKDGRAYTIAITDGFNKQSVLDWGNRLGVDLSKYIEE